MPLVYERIERCDICERRREPVCVRLRRGPSDLLMDVGLEAQSAADFVPDVVLALNCQSFREGASKT
jgi:hypothetical protein